MNIPNTACQDLDLGNHVKFECTSPFFIAAAFGTNEYSEGHLLCPICGSTQVRFDTSSTSSMFTRNKHFGMDFEKQAAYEEFDSGSVLNIHSLMIDFICREGHKFELDLHFNLEHPEEGVRVGCLLEEAEYIKLFPEAAERWG